MTTKKPRRPMSKPTKAQLDAAVMYFVKEIHNLADGPSLYAEDYVAGLKTILANVPSLLPAHACVEETATEEQEAAE